MGLRLIRVLVNLRKVQQMKGKIATTLRAAVSQNKRRYKKNGFDLDLTYITSRVIAMSAPALGGSATWRNDCHVVSRFLSLRHYASFFIFNLCDTYFSSDGSMGNYHPQLFFNQMQRIPFEDHGPPLLSEMIHFCREASKWLLCDPSHVICVHCKGGKGRTGVMIAAILLWSKHRKCAMDAMELFTFRRTENYDPAMGIDEGAIVFGSKKQPNRGVDGPSQQRYLFYLEAMLYHGVQPLNSHLIVLKALRFPVSTAQETKAWWISFTVKCQRTLVYDSFCEDESGPKAFGGPCPPYYSQQKREMTLPVNVALCEDTRIEVYRHKNSKSKTRKLMWFVVFHPAFYLNQKTITFSKNKLDMLHKDSKCKKADKDFTLTLEVDDTSKTNALFKNVATCAENALQVQQVTENVFQQHGKSQVFSAGQSMILHDDAEAKLILIASGIAEAVVGEDTSDSQAKMMQGHPIGNPVYSIGGTAKERVPIHTVMGPGYILGAAEFLKSKIGLPIRARTQVSCLILGAVPDAVLQAKSTSLGFLRHYVQNGRTLPIFECMSETSRMACFERVVLRSYRSGMSIVEKNGVGTTLYFVEKGSAVAVEGERDLRKFGAGEIFGEMAFVASAKKALGVGVVLEHEQMRVCDVVAAEDCECWELDVRDFVEANKQDMSSIADVMKLLSTVSDDRVDEALRLGVKSLALKTRRAWLVKKKLNKLQSDWRCIEVDCERKHIINKKIPQNMLREKTAIPCVSEQQLLESKEEARKKLPFGWLTEIHHTHLKEPAKSGTQSRYRVGLFFSNNQKPYQIEFVNMNDRHEFLSLLEKHVDKKVFKTAVCPLVFGNNTIKRDHIDIMGVPREQLHIFYQGLALNLALQVERTQTESLRISGLKALTDTDSLLQICDENEVLRLDCIKIFELASSEQVVLSCKCRLTTDDIRIFGKSYQRMRLILMSNYLVMDAAIFGPKIGAAQSTLLHLDQVRKVYDDNSDTSFDEHTFCLEVLSDDHEIEEWKVELSTSATCQEVRQNLMQFVLRGEVQRQVKLSERPFEDPGFMYIMEKCSTKHDLVKGQTLAHAQDSLFIIHTGEVIQMCDKLVYRHLREGSCFGETNFVKGTKSSEFSVHAISSTVVIEIHRLQVLQLTDSDSFLCARLWFTLCKVLNNNLLLSMQSTFPGIWSTPDHPDSATEELLPPVPLLAKTPLPALGENPAFHPLHYPPSRPGPNHKNSNDEQGGHCVMTTPPRQLTPPLLLPRSGRSKSLETHRHNDLEMYSLTTPRGTTAYEEYQQYARATSMGWG